MFCNFLTTRFQIIGTVILTRSFAKVAISNEYAQALYNFRNDYADIPVAKLKNCSFFIFTIINLGVTIIMQSQINNKILNVFIS